MYDYLKGYITDKRKNSKGSYITLEVSNIGYMLEVTDRDFLNFNISDSSITKTYITLTHREDAMLLYGFETKETRDIFQILLSVSGVGAKMALALLNEFDACDLISLVINENFKELTRAKGVGPKLAQKIILELKDKLIKTDMQVTKQSLNESTQATEDTQSVLLSLGYEEKEISEAINLALPLIKDKNNSEELLRKVLTYLST